MGNRGKELGEGSVGRERDGSVDIVDGWEAVGNIAFGASEKEAWISFGRAGNRAK